jgi:hypothetical protein
MADAHQARLERLGIARPAPAKKPSGMSKAEWKAIKRSEEAKVRANDLVNEFATGHGNYQEGKVVDLSGELGGKPMSITKVLINRGGTAIDRWIATDRNEMFAESEQRAIRYTQNLWVRAEDGLRAVDPSADIVDAPLGWAQQEAMVELKRLQDRVPRQYWDVYENVCRFDEEAGVAGSRLANNSRSAIDAAKTAVAFTASLIAMWRRL